MAASYPTETRGGMATRYFALILGIVYTLIGLAGFIPGLLTSPEATDPPLAIEPGYGYLFGLFPVNIVHTLIHLAIGIWGIISYVSFGAARTYARAVAIIFGLLTILGLIPGLNTLFGLAPLFSNDIWLHALTALLGAYFGWFAPAPIESEAV